MCFDVYRCAVGTGPIAYLNRVTAMTVVLIALLALFAIALPAAQRRSRRERPAVEVAGGAALPSGGMLSILFGTFPWRQYFDYYRPSFHPANRDTAHLLEEWKAWSASDPEIRVQE